MKNSFPLFVLFFLFILVSACEKTEKIAGSDVNGIWVGRWQINDGEAGTFITPVNQDDTRFDGDIYIRFDLPNLENHGVEYSGRIRDSEVRTMIEISGVAINASGDVIDDSLVSGGFNVSLGFSGTFEGCKKTLQMIDVNEVLTINNTPVFSTQIIYVNGNIWLPYPANNCIKVYDLDGNLSTTIQENFLTTKSSYDGEFFWIYNYDSEHGGDKIFKYDTLGNILNSFAVPSYFVDALAADNEALYYSDNYNRKIYEFNKSGEITDSISAAYNNVSSFHIYQNYIIYGDGYSPFLYQMTTEGEIIAGYQLPIENIRCITSDSKGNFWCLSDEYIYDDMGPGTSNLTIYHFTIE